MRILQLIAITALTVLLSAAGAQAQGGGGEVVGTSTSTGNSAGQSLISNFACPSHKFIVSWTGPNTLACAQPTIEDLSDWPVAVVNSATAGVDMHAKLNTAITSLGSGVLLDATAFTGLQVSTSGPVAMKQGVVVKLNSVIDQYCGASNTDSWKFVTTTNGTTATKVTFTGLFGVAPWATLLVIDPACANTMEAVIHEKWATHVTLQDLTAQTFGKGTYTVWNEQSTDDNYRRVVFSNDLASGGQSYTAGHYAWLLDGAGYGHYISVAANGGENPIRIRTNSTTVPTEVRSAIGYSSTDGRIVLKNYAYDIQAVGGFKSGVSVNCNGTSLPIFQNHWEIKATSNGVAALDADDESGMDLSCPVITGTEAIEFNNFQIDSDSEQGHDVRLFGNVLENDIYMTAFFSGAAGANAAYALYLENGTGTAPKNNRIRGVATNSTAQTANRAVRTDSGSLNNQIDVYTGGLAESLAGSDNVRTTDASKVQQLLQGTSPFVFDGATADGTNQTTIVVTDPTGPRNFTIPDANSVAVQPDTGAANNYIASISALGVIGKSRPACATLSDAAASCNVDATNMANAASGTLLAARGGTGQTTVTWPSAVVNNSKTAQAADVAATQLIASAAAGRYRFSCYIALTQAATTSSTLPACAAQSTDPTDSVVKATVVTASSAANTTSTARSDIGIIDVKASTAISYLTSGYASSGATAMQFKIYVTLETLPSGF